MATVQERQELAQKLKDIEADSNFLEYSAALDERLRGIPALPAFTEEQIMYLGTGKQVETLSGCTDLVTLNADGGGLTYNEWRDLTNAFFYDDEYPVGYDASLEDDLGLAVELIKRDAVAKACENNRADSKRNTALLANAKQQDYQVRSQWSRQVQEAVAGPKEEIAQIDRQLGEIASTQRRRAQVGSTGLAQLLSDKQGCLSWIVAGAVLLIVNRLTFNFLLSLGAGVVTFLAAVAVSVYFTNMSKPTDSETSQQNSLLTRKAQLQDYIKYTQAEPESLKQSRKLIADLQGWVGAANHTLNALGTYEWPLSPVECQTLAEVSSDLATSAGNLREANLSVIQSAAEQARAHRTQIADGIGLMPNAIPDALELATIIENGYADDVKEAMLFMATDRYRTSNLGLQAAQLRELRDTREDNRRYAMMMAQGFAKVAGQLEMVNEGIGQVSHQLGGISGQLHDMQSTLDSIDSSSAAAAAAAQQTAANSARIANNTAATARNTAATARNTAATARHARRAADASQDLRDFYAEDHPSHNANGDNLRLRYR